VAYLLDTNILSDIMRHAQGRCARRANSEPPSNLCTSVIVASELQFGAVRRGSERLTARLHDLLASIPVLPFEAPADHVYGRIRAQMEQAGTPIGHMDLLIAAQALAQGHVLVTDNEREFRQVEGLQVENWMRTGD
jgi:tRNA(fMet)-specific endonuclease VapC